MGKKKQQKEPKSSRPTTDEKGKKTYSLPTSKTESHGSAAVDALPKVTIPNSLEKELLDIIQTSNQQRGMDKEVSKRLTQKKLMDIYTSLSGAGFSHKQIEQAMENTILHGGDLVDALDWLCLNISNEKLPGNFSQALEQEEEKKRPKFDTELLQEPITALNRQKDSAGKAEKKESQPKLPHEKKVSAKDWILQYAECESDDSDTADSADSKHVDPVS